MQYDLFQYSQIRQVTLCGTNVYPTPEYHADRRMDEHDLMLICEGTWEVAQDEVIYPLKAGDAILLRAGSHHWGTKPCSIGSRNMFIHFTREDTDRLNQTLSAEEMHAHAQSDTFCLPTVIHYGTSSETDEMVRRIIQVFWSHQDDGKRRMNLLLNCLLNELASITRHRQPEADGWIISLLNMVHNSGNPLFTLEEAAEIVHVNVRSFSAMFHRVMGKSFHRYQMEVRLEMAYNALRTGKYTVKAAAAEHGFHDPYYFSKIFKQRYGVVPSAIRRGDPSANINRPHMR